MPRIFDFVFSFLALVALAPLFALLAVLVKLSSPGPVFHRGPRVGQGGRIFHVYKFRSMVAGAAGAGPGITRGGEPRVTSAGRFLRKYKLDELPQLLNVLTGEMSLVGPRPEDPRYVAYYTPEQRHLLAFRPGITSAASLHYRHEERLLASAGDWERAYLEAVLPEKLRLDLEYHANRTMMTDLRLLGQTFLALFR